MNQSFTLYIATESLEQDAQLLGVTTDDLQRIDIKVIADILNQPVLQLRLTYQITLPSHVLASHVLASQLAWPVWQQARVKFTDYLWEETCLECFITGSPVSGKESTIRQQTAPYIEVNASPDGRYALYKFKGYRNPATLPPTPLYDTDGLTRVAINWSDSVSQPETSIKSELSRVNSSYQYERRFSIPITELPNHKYSVANTTVEQIHPCVILQFGKCSLYFAPQHASPPDFHNHDYWSKFKL